MDFNKPLIPVPVHVKLAYICGQIGWSIASFGIMNLLFYFFDANKVDGVRMFPKFLPTIAVLSIIAGAGRILDAITDPIIAGWSDRSQSRFGRRRIFMAIGGLPFVFFSFIAFLPPVNGVSWFNGAWLIATVFLFYLFMTIYITPYFALIAELGQTSKGRLDLSTWIALAWAIGFLIGNGIYAFQGLIEKLGVSSVHSFQWVVGIYALIALVLVYLPVIFVNEKKYCRPGVSKQGIWEAIHSSFKNKEFRVFALADLAYFIALTFIQTGISFFVIQLMGESKEMGTLFMSALFISSFTLYIPISRLAHRYGNKKIIIISFLLLIFGLMWMLGWGILPFGRIANVVITILIMVFPISAFGFLFYAVAGDIAEADGRETGNYKEGLFFGTRTFMSKTGTAITLFIFPVVSHFGGKEVSASGLRLALGLAVLFLIIGLLFFLAYDENRIKNILKGERPEIDQ